MEREAVLTVISLAGCGVLCVGCGAIVRRAPRLSDSGCLAEVAAWRRLWAPLLPAFCFLFLVVGWALQEADDSDEAVTLSLMCAAMPFAFVTARAVARAVRSVLMTRAPLAGTIGLLRPRVVIDPSLAATLDGDELAAVHAHEQAHARSRDPLRIWLGQLAADLQWPAPAASARYRQWLHALELARDEEARGQGIDGACLAAAVVRVAGVEYARCGAAARLVGEGQLLRERVTRLLDPVAQRQDAPRALLALCFVAGIAAAIVIGVSFGDRLLQLLPGVLRA